MFHKVIFLLLLEILNDNAKNSETLIFNLIRKTKQKSSLFDTDR